jgi:hypothetical protein
MTIMKNLSLGILLGLSMGSMSIAFADTHFNDKNNLPPLASSGQMIPLPAAVVAQPRFNEKNEWVYQVPSKGPIVCPVDSILASHIDAFNDKYNTQC